MLTLGHHLFEKVLKERKFVPFASLVPCGGNLCGPFLLPAHPGPTSTSSPLPDPKEVIHKFTQMCQCGRLDPASQPGKRVETAGAFVHPGRMQVVERSELQLLYPRGPAAQSL